MVKRLIVVAAVVALPLFAQEAPRFSETTEVVVVNVDAVVSDKEGNRVTGLRADDFEIVEGGVPQKITNFSEIQESRVAPSMTQTPGAKVESTPAPPRRIVIMIDNMSLHPAAKKEIFDSARHFFRTSLRQNDEVMIVTARGGITLRLPFTSNKYKIEQTLNQLESEIGVGSGRAGRLEEMRQELLAMDNMAAANSLARRYAEMMRGEVRATAASMKAVLTWLSGIDGKKAVVFITEQLPVDPGIEAFRLVAMKGQGRGAALDVTEYSVTKVMDEIAATANAANTTLYPVYARGMGGLGNMLTMQTLNPVAAVPGNKMAQPPPPGNANSPAGRRTHAFAQGMQPTMSDAFAVETASHESTRTAFNMLAFGTGGLPLIDIGDFDKIFTEIASDLDSYYSLGYQPAARDVAERKIEVRMKNPSWHVRARHSFIRKTTRDRAGDLVTAALFSPNMANNLGVTMALGTPVQMKNKKQKQVPLQIRIPMEKLTLSRQGNDRLAVFDIHLRVADELGGLSQTADATREVKIPETDLAKIKGKFYTFQVDLVAANRPLRVAAGITDVNAQETSVAVQEMNPQLLTPHQN